MSVNLSTNLLCILGTIKGPTRDFFPGALQELNPTLARLGLMGEAVGCPGAAEILGPQDRLRLVCAHLNKYYQKTLSPDVIRVFRCSVTRCCRNLFCEHFELIGSFSAQIFTQVDADMYTCVSNIFIFLYMKKAHNNPLTDFCQYLKNN